MRENTAETKTKVGLQGVLMVPECLRYLCSLN